MINRVIKLTMFLWIPAAVYPCGSRGGNDTLRVFVIPAEAGIHS